MKTQYSKIIKHKLQKGKIILLCLPLFLIGVFYVSCDDNSEDLFVLSRLFRPINFTQTITGVDVDLSWTPITGATYLLEISRDSLAFVTDLQSIELPLKTATYTFEDLWGGTRYSARIKSVSSDPQTADSKYQTITFTMPSENILYPLGSTDIGKDYVTIKWDNTKAVNQIVVSVSGVLIKNVDLSAEDIQAGQKQILGLQPATEHQFSIYQQERLRGSVKVNTLSN